LVGKRKRKRRVEILNRSEGQIQVWRDGGIKEERCSKKVKCY
jgi:hypothetical protein